MILLRRAELREGGKNENDVVLVKLRCVGKFGKEGVVKLVDKVFIVVF